MDTLSHGLWGGISVGRKNRKSFILAFLFGTLPDLLSFGLYFIAVFLKINPSPDWRMEPPQDNFIPRYVHTLYEITHSIIIFSIIFALLWLIFRRPIYEFLAWGFHILLDIPTHSYEFFPTPFLWPISDFRVDGIPWSHSLIFIPNIVLLTILTTWILISKTKKRKQVNMLASDYNSEKM